MNLGHRMRDDYARRLKHMGRVFASFVRKVVHRMVLSVAIAHNIVYIEHRIWRSDRGLHEAIGVLWPALRLWQATQPHGMGYYGPSSVQRWSDAPPTQHPAVFIRGGPEATLTLIFGRGTEIVFPIGNFPIVPDEPSARLALTAFKEPATR